MENTASAPPTRRRLLEILGPALIAVLQVGGTFGAGHRVDTDRNVDALAVVIAVAGPVALLWVRRHPVAVAWFVSAITLGYLLLQYPYGPIFTSFVVSLIVAIVLGHRHAAWFALALVLVAHFLLRTLVLGHAWSWPMFLGVTAWALLVVSVAEFIKARHERIVAGRRARAEIARRETNEERLRIARELHDVVAHHISLINVQAGVALHLVDRKPEQAQTALAAIKEASKDALTELRSLVGVLRDEGQAAPRAPTAMLDSLDDVVERSAHAGLEVHKRVEGTVRPLPSAVELAAFRVIQESITNTVRHARAANAEILLSFDEDELTVQVVDDGHGGTGFERVLASGSEGSGVRGMRERLSALGGTLDLGAAPGGGVRVRAVFPIGGES